MNRAIRIAAFFFLLLIAAPAFAGEADNPLFFEAAVVEDAGPCNYFLFEIERGKEEREYAVVEWMGMDALEVGDRLLGRFEGGPEDIQNRTRHSEMNVWVHDFFFSYGIGFEALQAACRDVSGPAVGDLPAL